MARGGIGRLKRNDLKATTPGMLADGGNLYLQVSKGVSARSSYWSGSPTSSNTSSSTLWCQC
jgi:hypothetical protein